MRARISQNRRWDIPDAEASVAVAEAESALEALSVAEALSLELALDPEELDESVPDEPDALLPLLVIDKLHDLVSRTSGSPLSPVIGSSRIVHVCSMGPTALRKSRSVASHMGWAEGSHSRLDRVRSRHSGRLGEVLSIAGEAHGGV